MKMEQMRQALRSESGKALLTRLYGEEALAMQTARYETLMDQFLADFGDLDVSLFTSPEFDMLLKTIGDSVDLIVADTPPLGAVVDAAEIARRFDGAMLVLEYNKTRVKALKEAVALLKQTDTRILGCIMNKAPGGRRGYGGYYGGKYGYGYRRYSSSDADGKKGRRLRARKSREKA